MNNLIKNALAAQFILGSMAILHNWHIFRIENWIYCIYAALIFGAFLTWQVFFNKELDKTTKIVAALVGTVPMIVILVSWALISTSLH
jgi:uncharacterized membrane protein